jgi:tRNA pseudouridine32 synthase/23S rRNA pseudouridine746 synthase
MKIEFEKIITAEQAGSNITDFLAQETAISKQKIKDALSKGACWLKRGQKGRKRLRKAKEILQKNDQIFLFYDSELLGRKPEGAQCLVDAQGYSVWFKPAGMVAQGNDWCDHLAITRLAEQTLEPKRASFLIHRLDRETAGLIVIAHKQGVAGAISREFKNRKVEKFYRCLVSGQAPESGEIVNPLDGKPAHTKFSRLHYNLDRDYSDLYVEILTGRTHQIRRHLNQINHPVMGDPRYGSDNKNLAGMQLFAVKLAFNCPIQQRKVTFELSNEFLQQNSNSELSDATP